MEQNTNNTDSLNEIKIEVCEHKWQFVDDSFSHDWAGGGTEIIRYWECEHCGETKPWYRYDEEPSEY